MFGRQVLFHCLGELADVFIIGLVGNAKPSVGVQTVGQVAQHFKGNAMSRPGCVVASRAILPLHLLGIVRHLKIHKPQTGDTLPARQELRIPRILSRRLGCGAGHQDANVPHRICRIGGQETQKETVTSRKLKIFLPGSRQTSRPPCSVTWPLPDHVTVQRPLG